MTEITKLVLEKISSNVFISDEEFHKVKNDPDFLDAVGKYLTSDEREFSEGGYYGYILYRFSDCLTSNSNYFQALLEKAFNFYLENGRLADIPDILEVIDDKDHHLKLLEEKLQDPSYKISCSTDSLPILLKFKRYDDIDELNFASGDLVRIVDENGINVDDLPPKLKGKYQYKIYKLDELGNLEFFNNFPNKIIEFLKNPEIIDEAFWDVDWHGINYSSTDEQKKEIFNLALKRNLVDVCLLFGTLEDLENHIDEIIKDGASLPRELIIKISHSPSYGYIEKTQDFFIDIGRLDLAFNRGDYDEFVQKVLRRLEDHSKKFPALMIDKWVIDSHVLVEALLKNGYQEEVYNYFKLNTIRNDDVIKLVYNYFLNDEEDKMGFLPAFYELDPDVLTKIIDQGKISKIVKDAYGFDWFNRLNCEQIQKVIDYCRCSGPLDFINYSFQWYLNANEKDLDKLKVIYSYFDDTEDYYFDEFLDTLKHNDDKDDIFSHELFEIIRPRLAKKANTTEEKLEKLLSLGGDRLVCYLDSDIVFRLLRLSDEEFQKLLDLFATPEYEMSDMESFYDCLKQQEFYTKYPDVIEIFSNIMHSLQEKNGAHIALLETVYNELDETIIKKYNQKYPNSPCQTLEDIQKIFRDLVEKTNGILTTEDTNLLNFFTSFYISKKRIEFRRDEYDMPKDFELDWEYDSKDKTKFLINYFIKNASESVINALVNEGISNDIAILIVNKYNHEPPYMDIDLGKYIKVLIKAAIKCIEEYPALVNFALTASYDKETIKKVYSFKQRKINFKFLERLKIGVLQKSFFQPGKEAEYEELKKMIKKYKPHIIPERIQKYLTDNMILFDINDLAESINYYDRLIARYRQVSTTEMDVLPLFSLIKESAVLGAESSSYSYILTPENFQLIKANPEPNAAKTKVEQRPKEAVNWTLQNFKRKEVVVPPFKDTVTVGDKEIEITVGNFTDPTLLTLGERTGACMRIGGVGESLFEYCLSNKHGFHVVFRDKKTGKFLSRVSGFRNGNTVFLNELRRKCLEQYTNHEVVEACKYAAEELIRRSADSSCPIENVVCKKAYALDDVDELQETFLGISDAKEGIGYFYSDINSYGVVMATTSQEEFAPISLDNTKVPTYEPLRLSVIETKNIEEIRIQIQRISSVKSLFNGSDIDNIEEYKFSTGFVHGFVGEDWFAYLDLNGDIIAEDLEVDKRANDELTQAIQKLEEYKKSRGEGEAYGL